MRPSCSTLLPLFGRPGAGLSAFPFRATLGFGGVSTLGWMLRLWRFGGVAALGARRDVLDLLLLWSPPRSLRGGFGRACEFKILLPRASPLPIGGLLVAFLTGTGGAFRKSGDGFSFGGVFRKSGGFLSALSPACPACGFLSPACGLSTTSAKPDTAKHNPTINSNVSFFILRSADNLTGRTLVFKPFLTVAAKSLQTYKMRVDG